MHIGVVEDNIILAKSMEKVLRHHGYTVTHFGDGKVAYGWLKENASTVDLILLDILLPGMDGLEVAQSLRTEKIHTPILMLTSKNTSEDIVAGFDYGADDYLKKPFLFDELLVRIRALLRRPKEQIQNHVQLTPEIQIDMISQKVMRGKDQVHLTTREFALLSYLVHHKNLLLSQQDIYEHVFDFADTEASNTVEVHIKNIRKKLKTKKYEIPLETIRGRGYRLDL